MNFTEQTLNDSPLHRMALAVLAGNAVWFATWGWAMEAYKLGVHAWGYPRFTGDTDA